MAKWDKFDDNSQFSIIMEIESNLIQMHLNIIWFKSTTDEFLRKFASKRLRWALCCCHCCCWIWEYHFLFCFSCITFTAISFDSCRWWSDLYFLIFVSYPRDGLMMVDFHSLWFFEFISACRAFHRKKMFYLFIWNKFASFIFQLFIAEWSITRTLNINTNCWRSCCSWVLYRVRYVKRTNKTALNKR